MKGKQPVACYQFSLCGCMINWDSQPVVKTKTLGSLLLAASILFVGNTFAAINQLASYLNLQFFSESDLYDSQQKYLFPVINDACGRRGGLMVSALDLGASGPGSSPGRGHCVVFLGKTLYSHGASLTQVYKWVPANLMLGGNPAMD